jgi:hypothetical protein
VHSSIILNYNIRKYGAIVSTNAKDVISSAPNHNKGVGPSENAVPDSNKGGMNRATDDKKEANPKPMDPNNPTVASTDGKKKILDAIKQVDPGNISGFIKKAVDAMMMIRSIDNASGMGGGGGGSSGGASPGTAAAALGKGLIDASLLLEAAERLGLKAILDALNAIMPELIPLLTDDEIYILDQAILSVITSTNVGVLSPLEVENANATAAAIAGVNSLSETSSNEQLLAGLLTATTTIGGPTLGIDPNSLAYLILTSAVGSVFTRDVQINGRRVVITVRVDSSYIRDQLESIPTFTGLEQQEIAAEEAVIITSDLVDEITRGVLTAQSFLNILRGSQARIQDASMMKALGTNMAGLLGMAQQLISQFAGNINDSKEDHQPRGRLETVSDALQQHTKVLSLIKKKLDVSEIFDSMQSAAGQAQSQIQGMMGQIQSAVSQSGIANAMMSSDIVAMTSTAQSSLQSMLQSAQNPLVALNSTSLNSLINTGGAMLNTLNQTQVQSMLSALPPSLVMSLMGTNLTMMSNLDTNEMNALLATLPQSTVSTLLAASPTIVNFHNATSSLAEQTSDIAAALASVISTQEVGTFLKTILPNGTTVSCLVTHNFVG